MALEIRGEMKERPSVGIVVPNYNQGIYLAEALDSILNQPNIRIFIAIMDAGSTDCTRDIINQYKDYLYYWRSEPDEGQTAAINEGIQKLPITDYVCWLNADDTYLPHGLTDMVKFLEENHEYSAVYAKGYITNSDNEILESYPTELFSIERLKYHCFICQPATLVRRDYWLAIGGLDPAFQMDMDYDLWWRLIKVGPMGYLEQYVACSRDHDGTKTRNKQDIHFEEAIRLLRKHTGTIPWHLLVSKEYHHININSVLVRSLYARLRAMISFVRFKFRE